MYPIPPENGYFCEISSSTGMAYLAPKNSTNLAQPNGVNLLFIPGWLLQWAKANRAAAASARRGRQLRPPFAIPNASPFTIGHLPNATAAFAAAAAADAAAARRVILSARCLEHSRCCCWDCSGYSRWRSQHFWSLRGTPRCVWPRGGCCCR